MKIKSIKIIPYKGIVFNFGVLNDESYCVEGVKVANCRGVWTPIFKIDEQKPEITGIPAHIKSRFDTIDGKPVINSFKQLKKASPKGHELSETMQKPTVYLVRHGETLLNKESGGSAERIRGWVDVPLDDQGLKEAQRVGELLKDVPVKNLYSSNLQRASITADAIAVRQGIQNVQISDLRPWNLGDFQGQPVKEVLDAMIDHQTKHPDKEIPGGESWNTFLGRYINCLNERLNQAKAIDGAICFVSHYRNFKVAQAWIAAGMDGIKLDDSVLLKNDISTGAILKMTFNGSTWDSEIVAHQEK